MTERLKRVLCGEDNPDTARMLKWAMRDAPFRFDLEKTGESVMALYHAAIRDDDPYDLLFLDVAMPMKTGTTVLEEVRATGDMVPAIFCTALHFDEIKEQAAQLKARVLSKPYELSEAIDAICSILSVKCRKVRFEVG